MSPLNQIKKYKITFEKQPDHLRALVEGKDDDLEISLAYWSEIGAECERLGFKKVLVEEDLPQAGTFTDMYEVASRLPILLPGVTIAFVDRHTDQAELNEFGELVAQNCGVSGRFFSDPESAAAWLTQAK